VVAELAQQLLGALGQRRHDLDGADLAGQLGQDRGLVARAGADLEDVRTRLLKLDSLSADEIAMAKCLVKDKYSQDHWNLLR
jgi:hypothetical protein